MMYLKKGKACNWLNYRLFYSSLAVRTGLEPATPCVTGTYSNQLNYRTNIFFKELVSNESANIEPFSESARACKYFFHFF